MLKDLLQDYKDWLSSLEDDLKRVKSKLDNYQKLSDYDFHQLRYEQFFIEGQIIALDMIIKDLEK